MRDELNRSKAAASFVYRGKARRIPKKIEALDWSSFHQTSHPAEKRRMGHPVLFL
jgi:hypothetical protein